MKHIEMLTLSIVASVCVSLASASSNELSTSRVQPPKRSNALPKCINDPLIVQDIKDKAKANSKTKFKYDGYKEHLQGDSNEELAARLAYAETIGANCPSLNREISALIIQVIDNRVKIRKGNVKGVVFERDQFASSLNFYDESRFADFMCPKDPMLWQQVLSETKRRQQTAKSPNPTTVHYFLYKHSPRWTKEPWNFQEDTDGIKPDVRECLRIFKNPGWR